MDPVFAPPDSGEETGAIFGIALVQPSLKPADLALENVRFQQPELQEIQPRDTKSSEYRRGINKRKATPALTA